ncbi:MAG: ABC transporter permease [Desulfobulbus propionicus]|nr:MAG: ABC transporter permease [Desulfobulbus propionicus]
MVFAAGLEGLVSGELFKHASVSLGRVFCGFSLTCLFALPLACSIAAWPLLERIVSVPLEFIRITPPLAAIPLLILWFGIGEGSKLALIILASFFPVFLSALNGLRNVDDNLLEMGATIELSPWKQFRFIKLPAALPMIITGLRLGFGYSWRALIGAELIAAASGLGYMILDAEELARTDRVFVGILLIGLLGYLFDTLFLKAATSISRRLELSTGQLR